MTTDDTTCDLTIDASAADDIYAFCLKVLPTKGYTINHEQTQSTSNGTAASILFTGSSVTGFIDINGTDLNIDLQP